MSSLRNAVKRVTHKERSQPSSRSHLGILEKKRDYTARARDYHRKQDRLQAMQQRAAMRNPDEFYFGMKNAVVNDGKHRSTIPNADAEIDADTIRIMKDQDVKYIRMQRQKDAKKVEKLRASLHRISDAKGKHTVFVETKEQLQQFDAAQHFDTLPELVSNTHNRPRVADIKARVAKAAKDNSKTKHQLVKETKSLQKRLSKAQTQSYRELDERTKRADAMRRAEAHIVTEQQVASKGRKRKIKPAANGEPAQYQWRRRRLG